MNPDRRGRTQRYVQFHLAMMGAWVLLAVPTCLWWNKSVLWVALLSLYANWAAHFGAWQGARAERAVNDANGDGEVTWPYGRKPEP